MEWGTAGGYAPCTPLKGQDPLRIPVWVRMINWYVVTVKSPGAQPRIFEEIYENIACEVWYICV